MKHYHLRKNNKAHIFQQLCVQIEQDTLLLLKVYGSKEKRNLNQNALFHLWVGFIAKETGELKQEVYQRLVMELYEDDQIHKTKQDDLEGITKGVSICSNSRPIVQRVKDEFWFYESTTHMSKPRFQAFLREIEMHCAQNDIYLINNNSIYKEAFK